MYRQKQMDVKIDNYHKMRKEYTETGISLRALAKKYGCSYCLIWEIMAGKNSKIQYIKMLNGEDIRECAQRKIK